MGVVRHLEVLHAALRAGSMHTGNIVKTCDDVETWLHLKACELWRKDGGQGTEPRMLGHEPCVIEGKSGSQFSGVFPSNAVAEATFSAAFAEGILVRAAPVAVTVDPERLDPGILSALRQRGHTDEQICLMSPREAFVEYCEWHGMINWGDTLWDKAKGLLGAIPAPAPQPVRSVMPSARPDGECIVFVAPGDMSVGIPSDRIELYVDLSALPDDEAAEIRQGLCKDVGRVLGDVWAGSTVYAVTEQETREEEAMFEAVQADMRASKASDHFGTIKANYGEKGFLEGLGVALGAYSRSTGEFFARVPANVIERLAQFPADFECNLHPRAKGAVVDSRLGECSADDLLAEKAYLEWSLNGGGETAEATEPSAEHRAALGVLERSLYNITEELSSRTRAGAALGERPEAGPSP